MARFKCGCSRRDFLIKGMYGLGVGATLPGLLNRTSAALSAQALEGTSMEASPERILVVVELSGGNDGLNTVVPYGDDEYYRVRPTIGIPKSEVLKIDDRYGFHPSLVGFEEPENALHPTALGALVEALNYASHWVQVLATTHSVELLDQYDVPAESLLAVSREGDRTRIGRLHESCRDAIRDHRFTAGQLLRMGAVEPEPHGEDLQAL